MRSSQRMDWRLVWVARLAVASIALLSAPAGGTVLNFVERQYDGLGGPQLAGALSVAASPDGVFVYVAAFSDNAVTVFRRDTGSGELTLVEHQFGGVGGLPGLDGPSAVAVSPDGLHLYAVGLYSHSIAAFSRDMSTGKLSFIAAQIDGVGGVDGLHGARAVAVSPDGASVYATGDGVAAFQRDASSGALTFVAAHFDGVGGVDGIGGAAALTLSPDSAHVYVAGLTDHAVAVFSRNPSTGSLSFVEAQFDGVGGVSGLDQAAGVAVSPDGAHVYVAGKHFGTLAVFSRSAGTGMLTFVEAEFDGMGGVDGMAAAMGVIVSSDGSHVYVVAGADAAVVLFDRDAGSGAVTFVTAQPDGIGPGFGSVANRAATLTPDGQDVYVVGSEFASDSHAIAAFRRDFGTGTLTPVEVIVDNMGGIDGLDEAWAVAVSPDGAHVYATGRSANSVAVFRRDPGTGALTYLEATPTAPFPTALTLSPDGANLYVLGVATLFPPVVSEVLVFRRDAGTGAIIPVGSNDVGSSFGFVASSVTVSPEGAHVYVTDPANNAVVVFARDSGTGLLTHVDTTTGAGLGFANALALSPDGAHVYVSAASSSAVTLFDRSSATGILTFVESYPRPPAGPGPLLSGVRAVAVSPDGDHVYAAASDDNALTAFRRNPADGRLTFVESDFSPDPNVVALAISPAGGQVYVAISPDLMAIGAVATYTRSVATGALTLLETLHEGVDGVVGISGPFAVATSPDGHNVYIASSTDDSLTVFRLDAFCGDGVVDPGEECDDGNLFDGDCCTSACQLPTATCRSAGRSLLLFEENPNGSHKLNWDWRQGQPTTPAEFGDPTTTTRYAICVYDANGLVLHAEVPAGAQCDGRPCWKAISALGFRFKDRSRAHDGLQRIRLKSSGATIRVKGGGANLPTLTLPLLTPVTVRAFNSDTPVCWESAFAAGDVLKNEHPVGGTAIFKARVNQ